MIFLYSFIFPDIYLFSSFFVLFIIGIFLNLNNKFHFPNIYKLTCFFIYIFVLNIMILDNQCNFNSFNSYDFIKNDADILIKWILFFTILLFFCYTYFYIKTVKLHLFEYTLTIYFTVLSFCLFISTTDLLSFYLLLEIQSLCFYMLTAFNKNNQYSLESGLKYFILSSFSSIFLLYGFSFIYGITGTLNFNDIYLFYSNVNTNILFEYVYYISSFFILIAFLFKLYIAPFHIWIGDIYQGAPSMTTSLFATASSLPLFYVFIKFWSSLFYWLQPIFLYFIFILSVLSMILGLFSALCQQKIKRLIAFSSVSNVGYIFIAFMQESIQSYSYSILYFIMYIINITGLFAIFLNLYIGKNNYFIERFTLLSGYFIKNKILTICLVLLLFASAGIPPFPLFIIKILLLTGLSYNYFIYLIFILVFTAILSSYYYVRIIKNISFNTNSKWLLVTNICYINALIIIYIVLVNILFFILFGNLINVIGNYIVISIFF